MTSHGVCVGTSPLLFPASPPPSPPLTARTHAHTSTATETDGAFLRLFGEGEDGGGCRVDQGVGCDDLDGVTQDAFTTMWVPLSEMETQTDFEGLVPVFAPGPMGVCGLTGFVAAPAEGGDRGEGAIVADVVEYTQGEYEEAEGDAVARHIVAALPPSLSATTRALLLGKHRENKAKRAKNNRHIDDVTRFTVEEEAEYGECGRSAVAALAACRALGQRAVEFALASLAKDMTDEEKAVVRPPPLLHSRAL